MQKLIRDFVTDRFGPHARIVYACEAGSTAKGYATATSDHDLRVIVLRPNADYLRINRLPEQFETAHYKNDVDICAYDMTKALRLISKSNPNVREWLLTSVSAPECVYIDQSLFTDYLDQAMSHYLSLNTLAHHYKGMAMQAWSRWFSENHPMLSKGALQVTHSALSVLWLVDTCAAPPLNIFELAKNPKLDQDYLSMISDLMRLRELEQNDMAPDILKSLYRSVQALDINEHLPKKEPTTTDEIERIFYEMLRHNLSLSVLR